MKKKKLLTTSVEMNSREKQKPSYGFRGYFLRTERTKRTLTLDYVTIRRAGYERYDCTRIWIDLHLIVFCTALFAEGVLSFEKVFHYNAVLNLPSFEFTEVQMQTEWLRSFLAGRMARLVLPESPPGRILSRLGVMSTSCVGPSWFWSFFPRSSLVIQPESKSFSSRFPVFTPA